MKVSTSICIQNVSHCSGTGCLAAECSTEMFDRWKILASQKKRWWRSVLQLCVLYFSLSVVDEW